MRKWSASQRWRDPRRLASAPRTIAERPVVNFRQTPAEHAAPAPVLPWDTSQSAVATCRVRPQFVPIARTRSPVADCRTQMRCTSSPTSLSATRSVAVVRTRFSYSTLQCKRRVPTAHMWMWWSHPKPSATVRGYRGAALRFAWRRDREKRLGVQAVSRGPGSTGSRIRQRRMRSRRPADRRALRRHPSSSSFQAS